MISQEYKDLIIVNLKEYLPEEEWKHIEDMFSECYHTYEDGIERITLKPLNGEVAM